MYDVNGGEDNPNKRGGYGTKKMSYFIKHLFHFFTSTNQHRVHSPFVYDYVTKCLYSKQRYSNKKSIDIFVKSIAYFKVQTLLLPSETKDLENLLARIFPALHLGETPYDMIYSNASNQKNIGTSIIAAERTHNDTVVFVENIHKTKATELAWEQLKNNDKTTISIDLFYCGVVFFRKEQAKEHFKIRI